MKYKILLSLIISTLAKSSIAGGKPITLFIPPATAQEIENKTYTVPNLKTNRDAFINISSQQPLPITATNNQNPIVPLTPLPPSRYISKNRPKKKTHITSKEEKALKITEAYTNGSATPIIGEAGRTVFIYGQKQPTIICAVFTVCMIELQKDEIVLQQDAGDSVRWIISPGNGTPYISIKPTEANLQTNYIVITNKRQYTFKLQSTNTRYMSIVSFTYPDTAGEAQDKWQTYYKTNALNSKANSRKYNNINSNLNSNQESNLLSGKNLDYNYSYIGDAPFKPIRTWTDNIKTYIQLPKTVASGDIPIFNVLNKSKSIKLVNQRYDYQRQILEIDYKVEHGILQLSSGKDLQKLEIIHSNNYQDNSKFLTER